MRGKYQIDRNMYCIKEKNVKFIFQIYFDIKKNIYLCTRKQRKQLQETPQ
jgi:hypothetical protein